MRDEIRERYGKWLGKPGEKIRVAAIEQEDFFLGMMLKRMREYRLISLEELAAGICTKSDLEFMEKGIKANQLIAGIYLGRMGRSINKFEFYFTKTENEKQHKRDEIVKLWKENCLDEAKRCLVEYGRQDKTKYARYWSSWQERCIALRESEKQEDFVDIWDRLAAQRMYYLSEELDYLYELAEFYERAQQTKRARDVYKLMYENTLATGVFETGSDGDMDEERRLEILPELCLRYGHFERMQGRKEEAMQILGNGVELLLGCMRMEMLTELLEERIAVAEEIGRETGRTAEKTYRKMCRDMQNLLALDLVCGNFANAEKRLCRLKEVKWENTVLDSLSAVLERLSD